MQKFLLDWVEIDENIVWNNGGYFVWGLISYKCEKSIQ